MFAYCGNCPVCRVDCSGYGWLEDFWQDIKDAAEELWEDTKEFGYSVYYDITYAHFEGREKLNGQHPSYEEVTASGSEWMLLPPEESIYHDNGIGNLEEKYVLPDGLEAVFDGDTHLPITDSKYMATYNYVSLYKVPSSGATAQDYVYSIASYVGHAWYDVLPYYLTLKCNTRKAFENKVVGLWADMVE